MMTDFDNIGIHFDEENELGKFARENSCKMLFGKTEFGEVAYLPIGENIEIWYYGDKEYLDPYSMEMFYKEPEVLRGFDASWVTYAKGNDSALFNMTLCDGDIPIPLNIEIIDAFIWYDQIPPLKDGIASVVTTWYPKEIKLIKKGTEKAKDKFEMARESMIPCGTFPLNDDEGWQPSATALMNGLVEEANVLTNELTGRNYWHLKVHCLGYVFYVVVASEYIDGIIEPGDYVEGYYWISGKIVIAE